MLKKYLNERPIDLNDLSRLLNLLEVGYIRMRFGASDTACVTGLGKEFLSLSFLNNIMLLLKYEKRGNRNKV